MRLSKLLLWTLVFLSEVKGVESVIDYYDYPDFTDFSTDDYDYPDFTDFEKNDVSQFLLLCFNLGFPLSRLKAENVWNFQSSLKRVVKL